MIEVRGGQGAAGQSVVQISTGSRRGSSGRRAPGRLGILHRADESTAAPEDP